MSNNNVQRIPTSHTLLGITPMFTTFLHRSIFTLFVIGGLVTATPAAIVFNDTFEDIGGTSTKLDDAGDPNDLAWFSALNPGVASLQNDAFAGGGSTKALQLASPDAFRRLGAAFPSTTLGSNIGDKLVLSFAMRLTEAPTTNSVGLRIGLYNSNGTSVTSDNPNGTNQPTQQADDFGYYARFAIGTPGAAWADILEESANDNPLGGNGGTVFSTQSGSSIAINDQTLHTFTFELTRAGATSVDFALSYDGVVRATGTDSTSPFTTFDTVYFGQGNVSTDFRIDNVQLETMAVPEPATIVFAGLCVAGMLTKRRR